MNIEIFFITKKLKLHKEKIMANSGGYMGVHIILYIYILIWVDLNPLYVDDLMTFVVSFQISFNFETVQECSWHGCVFYVCMYISAFHKISLPAAVVAIETA